MPKISVLCKDHLRNGYEVNNKKLLSEQENKVSRDCILTLSSAIYRGIEERRHVKNKAGVLVELGDIALISCTAKVLLSLGAPKGTCSACKHAMHFPMPQVPSFCLHPQCPPKYYFQLNMHPTLCLSSLSAALAGSAVPQ